MHWHRYFLYKMLLNCKQKYSIVRVTHIFTLFISSWKELAIIWAQSIFYTTSRNGLCFLRMVCQRKWIASMNVNRESFGSKKILRVCYLYESRLDPPFIIFYLEYTLLNFVKDNQMQNILLGVKYIFVKNTFKSCEPFPV